MLGFAFGIRISRKSRKAFGGPLVTMLLTPDSGANRTKNPFALLEVGNVLLHRLHVRLAYAIPSEDYSPTVGNGSPTIPLACCRKRPKRPVPLVLSDDPTEKRPCSVDRTTITGYRPARSEAARESDNSFAAVGRSRRECELDALRRLRRVVVDRETAGGLWCTPGNSFVSDKSTSATWRTSDTARSRIPEIGRLVIRAHQHDAPILSVDHREGSEARSVLSDGSAIRPR